MNPSRQPTLDQLRQAGRELAERSCQAQGIALKLTRADLDRLAPLFRISAPARSRRADA
jgi:hypothetical protein